MIEQTTPVSKQNKIVEASIDSIDLFVTRAGPKPEQT